MLHQCDVCMCAHTHSLTYPADHHWIAACVCHLNHVIKLSLATFFRIRLLVPFNPILYLFLSFFWKMSQQKTITVDIFSTGRIFKAHFTLQGFFVMCKHEANYVSSCRWCHSNLGYDNRVPLHTTSMSDNEWLVSEPLMSSDRANSKPTDHCKSVMTNFNCKAKQWNHQQTHF